MTVHVHRGYISTREFLIPQLPHSHWCPCVGSPTEPVGPLATSRSSIPILPTHPHPSFSTNQERSHMARVPTGGPFSPPFFSRCSSPTRGTTRSSCPVPGGIEGGLDPRSRCEVLVPPSRKWLSVLNVLHRIPPRRVANRLLKRTSEQCRRRRYVRRRNGPLAARGRPHERGEPV